MVLPVAFGSGKFGTPWERMHLAKANAPALLLFAVRALLLLLVLDEPQAAIATAQLSATARPPRCLLAAVLVPALPGFNSRRPLRLGR